MQVKATLKPIFLGLFLLLAASSVAFGQGNSLIGELSDADVFHPELADSPLYNEWHYFNIIDEEQNVSIVCVFKLNGGIGAAEVLLGYYVDGQNPDAFFGMYPIDLAEYYSQTPDVKIAKSTVNLTPQGYCVHIESDDGSRVFDALFKPEVEPAPLFSASDFPSVYGGGVINWMVASAKMKVNGELSVGEDTYTLKNARGYHDHNWGCWYWGDDLGWDWGQVTQTKSSLNGNDVGGYSISFGNITDANHMESINSVLNVCKNKKIIAEFNDDEIHVEHPLLYTDGIIPIAPKYDSFLPAVLFPLPLKTNIIATSGSNDDCLNIEFSTLPTNSVPLPVGVIDENGIVKYRIIWEMIGTYNVEGEIDGKPISYTADGFMEYVSGEPVLPDPFP